MHLLSNMKLKLVQLPFTRYTGLLPTKGLTLPLVSYGGSSLLVSCAMLAVILRIDLELKKKQLAGDSPLADKSSKKDIKEQEPAYG